MQTEGRKPEERFGRLPELGNKNKFSFFHSGLIELDYGILVFDYRNILKNQLNQTKENQFNPMRDKLLHLLAKPEGYKVEFLN